MLCRATRDRWVMVERSDRMWSTGKGNGKPLQYFFLENPMNSMKRDSEESSPNHSLKVSVLRRPAFFMVQLSHPYRTTGKTIALTRWTFVGKVMSLLFNVVSRFIKARILKWFAMPFSSGPRIVRTLHHNPSILGGPTQHGSSFH